jgi:hypothetical protein
MKNIEKTLVEKRNENLNLLSEKFSTDKNLLSYNRIIKEEVATLKGACQKIVMMSEFEGITANILMNFLIKNNIEIKKSKSGKVAVLTVLRAIRKFGFEKFSDYLK